MRQYAIITIVISLFSLNSTSLLALDQQTASERINRIAKMSPIDRDRLNRNIQEFEALSAEEKDRYRQLHGQIMADRVQNGPAMQALMMAYDQWLQTLSPIQQAELQNETNIGRKVILVRRFKEEQERRIQQESDEQQKQEKQEKVQAESKDNPVRPAAEPSDAFPMKRGWLRIVAMDKNDLDRVMKVLINDLPAAKRNPDFEPPRLNQYCNIVEQQIQVKGSSAQWPDAELIKKIKDVLSPGMRWAVENLFTRADSNERETLVRLMLMGIAKQSNESFAKPTDEELKNTLESLEKREQDRVKGYGQQRQKQFLTFKFFELKHDDSFKKSKEYRDRVVELFERLEVPLPPILEKRPPDRK